MLKYREPPAKPSVSSITKYIVVKPVFTLTHLLKPRISQTGFGQVKIMKEFV